MQEENLFTKDCIRTFTGKYVNVFEPDPELICIEDIAHALSMQPRFGGHLPKFYSVAQHSHMVGWMSPMQYQLEGLMHDASEAYLMDIPSPIKSRLSNYKEIEDGLMKIIAEKFGFQYPLPESVKHVDASVLQMEWDGLMVPNGKSPLNLCFSQFKAKQTFMSDYRIYQYNKTKNIKNKSYASH